MSLHGGLGDVELVGDLFVEQPFGQHGQHADLLRREGAEAAHEVGEPDLILLDLSMPGVRGFSGLMYLRAQHPHLPVCVISASEDASTIRKVMAMGACGFIPKSASPDVIRSAIEAILAGEIWVPAGTDLAEPADPEAQLMHRLRSLTPQQVRVLMMLGEGLLNKQIAYELSVSEATVKAHVSAILQKLNVENRTQAVLSAGRFEVGEWSPVVAG